MTLKAKSVQHTITLYMADSGEVVEAVERLSADGYIVTVLAPLMPFKIREDNGLALTDWLIVFYKKTELST